MNIATEDPGFLSFDEFLRVEINTGTIIEVRENTKARAPAYILAIDFGRLGIKHSSAQLTRNYDHQALIGKQIVAVTNFKPKRIAGFKSEVLVLGAVCDDHGVVLLEPTFAVSNGTRIG